MKINDSFPAKLLRIQESTMVFAPSVSLVHPKAENCCLCGMDYGECNIDGSVIPFQSLCELCARKVKDEAGERRKTRLRALMKTARTAVQKDTK